jgi:hypothetical protein
MALGDNFNYSVDHFDGGLIVIPVGWNWYGAGHSLHLGRGTFRVVLVIQVREHRNQPNSRMGLAVDPLMNR